MKIKIKKKKNISFSEKYIPSALEIERRRRINIALWAYAYEIEDSPLVSDAKFDNTCLLINPAVSTGHLVMDNWFRTKFNPHTGSWIRCHPELEKIQGLYYKLLKNQPNKYKI